MKKRSAIITVAVVVLAGLYLLAPGCGSNNNQASQAYIPGTTCIVGQVCTTGSGFGLTGSSILPGVVVASIDSMGSTVQLQIGATSGASSGYAYSGPVSIAGVVNFAGSGACPPGSYQLQGQGQWIPNYGGHVGQLQGQFTLIGGAYGQMQGAINGLVSQGQDPNVPNLGSQFYISGLFQTSCNPGGVAL